MKKLYLLLILAALSISIYAQENNVTVSGGYAFFNVENTDVSPTGWRINGTYEFNPLAGPWAFGINIGYIGLTANESGIGSTAVDLNVGTIPIYFSTKYLFGSDKIKGFIKGAIGTQNSQFKRTGYIEVTDHDWGFYGGGSAGIKFFINEKIFLNGEYELAWLSNASYKDGVMNSAMLGIGFTF
jgi:hypothetical protein